MHLAFLAASLWGSAAASIEPECRQGEAWDKSMSMCMPAPPTPDAEVANALDGVDAERPSHFARERYVPWHVAQCPMTSRACEVAAKPCWTGNSSTIAATVRSKARLGVTSITLPHIEQSKWW